MRHQKRLWGGVESIAVWDGKQIKNVSLDDLRSALGVTSCWNAHRAENVGWRRFANVNSGIGSPNSCVISIKRTWNNGEPECHKVQLINTFESTVFKSIYDKSDVRYIERIRCIINNDGLCALDYFYNSSNQNDISITIEDNIVGNRLQISWELLNNPPTVPETTDRETVLATMDFDENTWLGQPL